MSSTNKATNVAIYRRRHRSLRQRAALSLCGLLAAAGLLQTTACTLSPPPAPQPPPEPPEPICSPSSTPTVSLGDPWFSPGDESLRPAYFTTNGQTIYLVATKFDHGGIGDIPHKSTSAFIGKAATPPQRDTENFVAPILIKFSITEDKSRAFELTAGAYWIITNLSADIAIGSCDATEVTGSPAPRMPMR
jgi:hypothetical protein